MAQQNNGGNGKGTSKEHDPEKDRANRKAAQNRKAARRGSSKGLHVQPLFEAVREDKSAKFIEDNAEVLSEILKPVMCSSSAKTDKLLKDVFDVFIRSYSSVTDDQLRQAGISRSKFARTRALEMLGDDRLSRYVSAQLGRASKTAWERRNKVETSEETPVTPVPGATPALLDPQRRHLMSA